MRTPEPYQPRNLQGVYEVSSWSLLRAYMLSALIRTEHSYRAVPLAGQLVDQRFVHPGPLVTYSPITRSVDYIFPNFSMKGWGAIYYRIKNISTRSQKATQVVTGSDLKLIIIPFCFSCVL